MKKLLASVLAVVMLLCMGIVTTYAAEEDVILTVTPNITTAETGAAVDVVYTIKITPNNGVKVGAFSFNLVETEKMTLSTAKATSQGGDGYWVAKLKYDEEYNPDGIFETAFEYKVGLKYFAAAGGTNERCLTSETVVMTIKATIAEGEVGEFTLNASNFTVSDPLGNEITGTSVKTTPVVVSRAPVPATGIKLNKSELALASGADETLSATVTPNDSTDKVSWESNNPDVASVDENGKVTAHKVGTAVITATAGTKTDTCTVTVTCGHGIGNDYPAEESTCTVKGHDAYIQCGDCGQLLDEEGNEIEEIPFRPLAAHKGGTATCKDKAVCSVCNQPYGDFAAHNYGDPIKEEPADHNHEGMKAHYKCSVCGKLFTESKVETTKEALIIPKVAHEYGDWKSNEGDHWKECGCGNIIDKAPHSGGTATCTERAVCSVCKVPYGKTAPHSYTVPQKDASYHWNKCANCNAIDMNVAHTFDQKVKSADTLKTAADCNDDAVYYYSCSCGQVSTTLTFVDTGSATGNHTDADNKWETDGTKHWHTCECGEVIDEENHKGGTATCHDLAVCEVCDTAYGALDEDNHVYDVVEVKEPTCTEKGYTVHTCKYHSDATYNDTYTDALGHKVVEWTVTKEATAKESGTKTGKCTVCGEVITAETGKLISKVEGDSAKVEAVGDTTLYEKIILKTDKVGDKLSDTDKADMQTKIEALKLSVDNIKMAEIFDISLFLRDTDASGNPIQDLKYEPNGKIRITMEVPEAIFKNFKNVKLLHFLDDGTVEAVDYTLDGSKAVFETESLSYFAFAGTPIVTDTGITNENGTKNENNGQASSPKTGDSSNPIVWIAVLLVSALTVGTVSVYSRKKNCRACKK